jgi:hypothetical protein
MSYLNFKGVQHLGEQQFTNELGVNLQFFTDWAFLNIGGFFNVNVQTSGAYGGNFSRLRPANDPYFSNRIYEGARSNWVYESGITYPNYSPINISGVYVNGTFYPSDTTGVYAHKINYPLGRVIFNSVVPQTGLTVQLEHSYKWIKIQTSDVPWAQKILYDSFRVDDPHFLQRGSGVWDVLSQSRVQLPAIIIEPSVNTRLQPLEIGGGQRRIQTVYFHVISENPWDRNNITDILVNQRQKTIFLFDVNTAIESGKFPLDPYYGNRVSGGFLYPAFVDEYIGYRKKRCAIVDTFSEDLEERNGTYRSIVKWVVDVELPES